MSNIPDCPGCGRALESVRIHWRLSMVTRSDLPMVTKPYQGVSYGGQVYFPAGDKQQGYTEHSFVGATAHCPYCEHNLNDLQGWHLDIKNQVMSAVPQVQAAFLEDWRHMEELL